MEYRSILDPTHSATKRPTLRTARDIADGTIRPESVAARAAIEAELVHVDSQDELSSEAKAAATAALRRVLGQI